ncbi:MAG TPA: hypothetical protein VJA21_02760 [Verrucomicrobiae bacterium]
MIDSITNYIENNHRPRTSPAALRFAPALPHLSESETRKGQAGFTRIFRWPVPAGQTAQPTTVEVVGSFSGWRKLPLSYDPPTRTWQLLLNNIEGNRTHRYVVLVDGKPSFDQTCDGMIAPQTPEEAKWSLATPKGSRVMLLFSQTK